MAPFGAPISVDGLEPAAPPRATILEVSEIVPDATGRDRWMNGVGIYAYPCGPARKFDQCATVVVGKTTSTVSAPTDFGGFTVYLASKCTMRGVGNDDAEFKRRALASFEAFEHEQVEAEWWDGAIQPNNVHLTTAAGLTILNGGTTTNLMNGLALLEGAVKRDAVIHATRRLVTGWASQHLVVERNGRLETWLGTPIIAGSGYSGAAPNGQPVNTGTIEWAFVTTPLQIFRGPAFVTPDTVAEALDRSLNDLQFYAERQYTVAFDQCLRTAVRIDRNQAAA